MRLDKNNLAHLLPPHRICLTLSSHPPTFAGRSVAEAKKTKRNTDVSGSAFCPVLSIYYEGFFFSPLPLHCGSCVCLQSQTTAAGQGDMPLNPEEFSVGDSTGEKLIVFPSVQFFCLVDPPPSIVLRIPCWFPSIAYAPAV